MYAEFYNLKEKPFNLTPSPRFLYLSETHKEALALLNYGLMEQKGFVLLTGEVGTGKTTIIQTFLENLDSSIEYVYISNPTLSPVDFLSYVASSLGLEPNSHAKSSLLAQLKDNLQHYIRNQQKVLLIVDEAQNVSLKLLEEIRLLSNMETADDKLINIFLIGQPELNQKLSNPKCRPLLQRISIRYHINPLNIDETEDYIKTRLQAAGAKDLKLFSKEVIKVIHKYAKGYPRMINILCDNVLLLGYSNGKKRITSEMIEECYDDLQLPDAFLKKDHEIDIMDAHKVPGTTGKTPYLRTAALSLMLFFLFSVISFTDIGKQYLKRAELFYRNFFSINLPETVFSDSDSHQKTSKITKEHPSKEEASPVLPESEEEASPPKEEKRVITVKPGDTLLGLAMEVYGLADKKTLEWIKMKNPQIRNVNMIEPGQQIVFPTPAFLMRKDRSIYSVHITTFKTLKSAQYVFRGLVSEGYEAYILPFVHPQKGKMFRIAVGAFEDKAAAREYGRKLLDMGVVDYAEAIRIDMM
jgi:general secretion pathway protein A